MFELCTACGANSRKLPLAELATLLVGYTQNCSMLQSLHRPMGMVPEIRTSPNDDLSDWLTACWSRFRTV